LGVFDERIELINTTTTRLILRTLETYPLGLANKIPTKDSVDNIIEEVDESYKENQQPADPNSTEAPKRYFKEIDLSLCEKIPENVESLQQRLCDFIHLIKELLTRLECLNSAKNDSSLKNFIGEMNSFELTFHVPTDFKRSKALLLEMKRLQREYPMNPLTEEITCILNGLTNNGYMLKYDCHTNRIILGPCTWGFFIGKCLVIDKKGNDFVKVFNPGFV
jgi:hypothetical protein